MSTKRELVIEALTLGKQLGVEVAIERKNHLALTQLVEDLRRRVQAAGGDQPGGAPRDAHASAAEANADDGTSVELEPDVAAAVAGGVRRTAASPIAPEASSGPSGAGGQTAAAGGGKAEPDAPAAIASGVRRATDAPGASAASSGPSGAGDRPAAANGLGAPTVSAAGGTKAEPREPTKALAYRVARGRVLTTPRGYLTGGELVRIDDFSGRQRTIDLLLAKGVIEPS